MKSKKDFYFLAVVFILVLGLDIYMVRAQEAEVAPIQDVQSIFRDDERIQEILATTTPDLSTALIISNNSKDNSALLKKLDEILKVLKRISKQLE